MNTQNSNIRAVIFDVDNTLLATNVFVQKHLQRTLQKLQKQNQCLSVLFEEAHLSKIQATNPPFEKIFETLFVGQENGKNVSEIILAAYREDASLYQYEATFGALETINQLKQNGMVFGIVTNRLKMLDERLTEAGFSPEDFFVRSIPSSDAFRKPHPRAFEEAIRAFEKIGISPEQIVMVGDHPDDYFSSRAQGMNFIGVIQGTTSREEFLESGLSHQNIIDSLVDFEKTLKNLSRVGAYKKSLLNVSALDGRHMMWSAPLQEYFSEYALHKNRIRVEIEHCILLSSFFEGKVIRKLSDDEVLFLRNLYLSFSLNNAMEVLEYDHIGRNGVGPLEHDVKSCEMWIREKIQGTSLEDIAPFIHIFLTSEDVNNLAYKTMLRGALNDVFLPKVSALCESLFELSQKYKSDPLMARTHLQPASPTTFGKVFVGYLSRLIDTSEALSSVQLFGKVNGAVGNYNAFVAAFPSLNWTLYSQMLVEKLGCQVDFFTDQRGPHADVVTLFQAMQRVGNVLRDCAQDLSLYAAFGTLYFSKIESHVGSSVMPHKINPWFAECAEGSLKKANAIINGFSSELDVSRLQRDLSDHEFERSYGEAFGYVLVGIEYMTIALGLIRPNLECAKKELEQNPQIVTEAIQTILRVAGKDDAYEEVKKYFRGKDVTLQQVKEFVQNLSVEESVKQSILLILDPVKYLGLSEMLVEMGKNKYKQFKIRESQKNL